MVSSGEKPSNPAILKEAIPAYTDVFATMMIVLAIVTVVAGVASYLLIRKYGSGEQKDTLPLTAPSTIGTASHAKAEHVGA